MLSILLETMGCLKPGGRGSISPLQKGLEGESKFTPKASLNVRKNAEGLFHWGTFSPTQLRKEQWVVETLKQHSNFLCGLGVGA